MFPAPYLKVRRRMFVLGRLILKIKHLLLLVLVLITTPCDGSLFSKSSALSLTKYPVYALNYASNSISKIDGEKDEIVSTIKLPDVASTFSVAPNGNLVVAITGVGDILAPYKAEIHIIAPDGKPVGSKMKIKYIPDNMYIKDNRIGSVIHNTIIQGKVIPFTLVDLEKRAVISIFDMHEFVQAVDFKNNDLLLYLVDTRLSRAKILQINLDDRSVSEVMELGEEQIFGKIFFHNGKLYGLRGRKGAMLALNQTLQVIDLNAKKIEKILPLPDSPYSLAFVEDKIYITHFNDDKPSQPDNRVSIIDSKTYKIENILEVGRGPAGICYSKSLGKVYTANFWDNSVSVIDVKSRKVIKTIPTNQTFTNLIRCPE